MCLRLVGVHVFRVSVPFLHWMSWVVVVFVVWLVIVHCGILRCLFVR